MSSNIDSNSSRAKGYIGEDRAADFLLSNGYSIISRNYQAKDGEIDCIAKAPDGTLVFIEVKYARSSARGNPAFWVTPGKQKKLAFMARRYLAEHKYTRQPCRFDVITIVGDQIDHIRNAFLV
jgi:putative endonuclease